MSPRRLHAVMIRLARRFRLRASYDFYGSARRSQVESVAHELAHGVDLAGRPLSSAGVARAVTELGDRAADQHELRTQRIEVHALRALGFKVSAHDLAATATWRRIGWRPGRAVNARLTPREKRGVAMVVSIVLAEAGAR